MSLSLIIGDFNFRSNTKRKEPFYGQRVSSDRDGPVNRTNHYYRSSSLSPCSPVTFILFDSPILCDPISQCSLDSSSIIERKKKKPDSYEKTTTRGPYYGILRPIMFDFFSSYLYINFFFINKIHIKISIIFLQSLHRHPSSRWHDFTRSEMHPSLFREASNFACEPRHSRSRPSRIHLTRMYVLDA